MSAQNYEVFNSLIDDLSEIITNIKNPIEILEVGAKEFVNDLSKLSRPYSQIKKSDYTHLVDSFAYVIKDKEIEVGWQKYYGRMVEEGTKLTPPQPHLVPTYEKNQNKYYEKMIEKIYN